MSSTITKHHQKKLLYSVYEQTGCAVQTTAYFLERVITTVSVVFGWFAVLAVVCLPAAHVFSRVLDVRATTELEDFEVLFFFGLVMLSLGYTYLADRHVRIDVWRERTGPRLLAVIEVLGCLGVLFPLCAMMIWVGGESAWRSFLQGERMSEFGGLPLRWMVRACLPLGFGLLLAAGLSVVLRNAVFLASGTGGPSPTDPAGRMQNLPLSSV